MTKALEDEPSRQRAGAGWLEPTGSASQTQKLLLGIGTPAATRRVEWLAIALVVVVASVLAIVPSLSYRAVRGTFEALVEAQGSAIAREVRVAWGERDRPPTVKEAKALLRKHRADGLRYLAVLGPRDEVFVEAGESAFTGSPPGPGFELGFGRGRIVRDLSERSGRRRPAGGRPAPPPGRAGSEGHRLPESSSSDPRAPGQRRGDSRSGVPKWRGGEGMWWPGGSPGRGWDGPRGGPPGRPGLERVGEEGRPYRPPLLVVEIDSARAAALHADADRARIVGVAAALLFCLLGGVFVQSLRQRTRLQQALARRRHLASLGEMSAVMAHELRNPLASLKGHAQLLAEALPGGSRQKAKADRVVAEAKRLEVLTTDLLDFARASELQRREVDPAALLRDCVAVVCPREIEIEVEGAPARWSLDPQRMRQALENVLHNARQVSPGGECPTARVLARGRALVFEIDDSGPGIPPESLQEIFRPFYTRRVRGTGLGLAVARRVVEQHGGLIVAENRPEGGARFRITIPRGRL